MRTDELNRLSAIAPQRCGSAGLLTAAERQAILDSALSGGSLPRARRRPVPRWTYPLVPVAVAAAVAAVMALASAGSPAATSHGRVGSGPPGHGTSQTRTVAYVTRRARAALAAETSGTLRDTLVGHGSQTKVVEDLSTHAARFTTSDSSTGATMEDDSSTGGARPISTFVDYGIQSWWTANVPLADYAGATSGPQILRGWLAEGVAVVAGQDIINGQQAIHLHIPSTIFTLHGKRYAVSITDVWVSAQTFLPLRETGIDGAWTENLAWSSQPPSPAEITAVVPAGFTHLNGPPPSGG